MTSELKAATAFGSGIQTKVYGQSVHLHELLQRRVLLQSSADRGCAFIADIVAIKAVGAEARV